MKRNLYLLIGILSLFSCNPRELYFPLEPIAYWTFSGNGEEAFISMDKHHFKLLPGNGVYPKIDTLDEAKGVLRNSICFDGEKDWLYIPYKSTGDLDIKTGEVTVIALIKWEEKPNCFVAGMWNEYESGGKRQYGLFVSLPHYNGDKKVCGHISKKGGPTPPFPYSIDYSTSKSNVEPGNWHYVAMTYDGKYIRSYYDGSFEEVKEAYINNTKGFEGYPNGLYQKKNPYYYPDGLGSNGSDFTVGAVQLKDGMGNFFKGQIAEISVFNRCLDNKEIKRYMLQAIEELNKILKEKYKKEKADNDFQR